MLRSKIGDLEYYYDKLVPGGIIVLDDYGWNMFHKRLAVEKAFFKAKGLTVLELPTGQGLVVKPLSGKNQNEAE